MKAFEREKQMRQEQASMDQAAEESEDFNGEEQMEDAAIKEDRIIDLEERDEVEKPAEEGSMEVRLEQVAEAVLFAADEPIPAKKLAEIIGAEGVTAVKQIIEQLNGKYEQMNCAFRIEGIAGGFQMLTLPVFNAWLKKLVKVRGETKLSPAALETLAIIAYKQPLMRVDVEVIRGVAAGEMIRQLIDKGLVKIVGRAEELGRPLLYGTTKKFLETFGLNSLKDLPTSGELKQPGEG